MQITHVRETLYRFGEVFNGFVCIAVFDAVPDTVLDVSLQNNPFRSRAGRILRH